jgi:hypothetical protein
MKAILIVALIFLPFLVFSQSSYDLEAMGVYIGNIRGGIFSNEEIKIEITNSNYVYGQGVCEGFVQIGDAGRINFIGKVFVEADMPYVEWIGKAQGLKNGLFHLEIGCIGDDEIEYNVGCGTWTSEDEKTVRRIRVVKQL